MSQWDYKIDQPMPGHRIEINRKATRAGTFEVCVSTHVSLRMFIMQLLASQLSFLANRNAELAVPPLFWPVNCVKIDRGTCCTAEWSYCLYPILWPGPFPFPIQEKALGSRLKVPNKLYRRDFRQCATELI